MLIGPPFILYAYLRDKGKNICVLLHIFVFEIMKTDNGMLQSNHITIYS